MIDRWTQGALPEKPHTVFREGPNLLYEECFTRLGFDGPYSILYHRFPPTMEASIEETERGFPAPVEEPPKSETDRMLRRRLFDSGRLPQAKSQLDGRAPL